MLRNLMTPGGRLGYATVVIAGLLACSGLVAVILSSSGVGIEKDWERAGAAIAGAVALTGIWGLILQSTRPTLGGVLAVLGSVAAALLNSWLILPVLMIPATIIIVIVRARRLSGHTGTMHNATA